MITHIVAWNFKKDLPCEQHAGLAGKIKNELENLKSQISGITEISVYTAPLTTSGKDLMLYSVFSSEEALKIYQLHPSHQKVSQFIGTVTQDRVCLDFNS